MYLNCHTYYSLRYGTLSPEQLISLAVKWKLTELVLTDINNTSCAFEWIERCTKAGIKPILGIDFRKDGRFLYIGIAKNRNGWYQLNQFLSQHSLEGKPLPEVPPQLPDTYIIYPRLIKPMELFYSNEYLGIRPEHVHRIYNASVRERMDKLVVLSPISFMDSDGWTLHKLLRAIDKNVIWTKLEKKDYAKATDCFIPPEKLASFYKLYPDIIKNTRRLLSNCTIKMETGLSVNRQIFTGSKAGDFKLLEKLALNGCYQRYGIEDKKALQRVEKELKVIFQQDFCPYFLITWDIIRYAQSMGYHHVGRGSGANSIVAFCLGISDVDPIELDLYFERFINPYRTSPPDFDIDFSWDERDDVLDYIFKRYGQDYTALLATYTTFKGKSIIRELGKVFGLPKAEIDNLINDPATDTQQSSQVEAIFKYGKRMDGFPNYLSIHAGGILITERPIYYHTAIQMMPKGFPITHVNMYHAEDIGFHKYDVLSQRGLGHIKDTITLIRNNQGKAVDIHKVAAIKQDEKVKTQLRSGHCIGCFYIESPAMRGLLSKLKCDNYTHLVAASSIIRPGVAKSGMMREYIFRFHNPYSFRYLHKVFEEHLGETFGVMVYQEDVMKIVHHFAGLDLDESDVLRRIMSGKKHRKDTFHRLRKKYFSNCKERGYSDELVQEVWRQVESFSGYSFCKAHSASFAVESFQSLYLKAYFPLEFMVAVINNFGGFYKTEYYFHEARMQGATISPPCVNKSEYLTTIYDKEVYIGFIHLHSMERNTSLSIIKERKKGGDFKSLADFINRVKIGKEQLEILIRIGAFRFTKQNKYELMWEKNALLNPSDKFEPTARLFEEEYEKFELPDLKEGLFDQSFDEIELLGFPLSSPFSLLTQKEIPNTIVSKQLEEYMDRTVHILGYYVCRKDVRTVNQKRMQFGTWLDKEGFYFDTTHFPNVLKYAPLKGKGIYLITGKVVSDFGFHSIEVTQLKKLPLVKDERY